MNTILKSLLVVGAAGFVAACASVGAGAAAPVDQMADEADVRRVVHAIDLAVDDKDWPAARERFTDEIYADFTSLVGGEPATIPADALVGGWSANLGPKKTSYHQRGYVHVTVAGDEAVAVSNGYAWNRMEGNGDPLWEVWGRYEHTLTRTGAGWKVDGMTFEATHERGNMWVRDTPSPAN